MTEILLVLALVNFFILVYVLAGYPVILWLLVKTIPAKDIQKAAITPSVTLIISCFNEEEVLDEKIRNSLSLDYPEELLDIIVVSDGSTDKTDEIALSYAERGVRLIRQEGRLGKTMGLNLSVPQAYGEIIVFSDANAMYKPQVIRRLVENFADPVVGYVVGEAQYSKSHESAASSAEDTYWNYEIAVKTLEGRLHSVVGGDGAIYAIRKELYEELEYTDINDFVNPLQIISKGFRGIYEPGAVCYEDAAGTFEKEFKRKVRIVNRAFSGLMRVREVMNPRKCGFFSFEVISHKFLRWLSPFFIILFSISSVLLALQGIALFQGVVILLAVFILFTLAGLFTERVGLRLPKVMFLPYYFTVVNIAALEGVLNSIRGDVQVTWEHARGKGVSLAGTHKSALYLVIVATLVVLVMIIMIGRIAGAAYLAVGAFWGFLITLFYIYLGYPLVLLLWQKISRNTVIPGEVYPAVTVVISAYNEEEVIEAKILNALTLDYPPDKLEIMVVSDGSSDNTVPIARTYERSNLRLLDYPERRGKIGAMIEAISHVTTEIVVLSDANVMYAHDALRKLVRNFADPSVGAVSADVILDNEKTTFGASESLYYKYERWIQKMEGSIWSIIGADGAMYAVRRSLFVPPSPDIVLDDFVISMNVALQGYRVVYEEEAKGYEENAMSYVQELSRKSRIIAGGIQSMKRGEGVPSFKHTKLFLCYVSHKLLRWFTPLFMIGLMVATLVALFLVGSLWYKTAFVMQMAFYGVALFGLLFVNRTRTSLFNIPFYFCMENTAALLGIYKGMLNLQPVTWKTFRKKSAAPSNE